MADKNKTAVNTSSYERPKELGAWEGTKQFLWNGETGQFMGRTGGSWGRILLFYLIFYAVLSIFFITYWLIFASTLLDGRPKYELKDSIIGDNPGLGFRPMPPESNVESTLVWYQKNNANNSKYWIEEIKTFLLDFENKNNTVDCKKEKEKVKGKSCKVDVAGFGACTARNDFGYPEGKPCIFLKLNKIYKWNPDYYLNADELPEKMPQSLKSHISSRIAKKNLEVVWVSCEGENPADVENLGKDVDYIGWSGEQGFNGNYFPYENTEGYLQPLVAVQFKSVKPGVLINIECKAWAKNIKHDRQDRRGSVHFELMIDEAPKPSKKEL